MADYIRANYAGIKNTAKNGRLLRCEIRELVLAAALQWGFFAPKIKAIGLYPGDEHRQEQYTELPIMCKKDNSLQHMVTQVIADYFKFDYEEGDHFLRYTFHDTKKLRVYRKRIEFGRAKKWKLRKNWLQYFWTAAPLAYLFKYGVYKDNSLCFAASFFIENAENAEENMLGMVEYIQDICHIDCFYDHENNPYVIQFTEENWQKVVSLVEAETERLRKKFIAGKYIPDTKTE